MAHYAIVDDNNVVTQVIVGRDEDEVVDGISNWEAYYGELLGGRCLRTSYNTRANEHTEGGEPFRGNYAGIGYTYMEDLDIFMPGKPFESWVLNEATASWDAPVPMPEDGGLYSWDESAGNWVSVEV